MHELQQLLVSHWTEVVTFLLVLGRTSGLVVGAPFWGGAASPRLVRVVLAMGLGVAVYPFALPAVGAEQPEFSLLSLLLALGREVLFGLVIGWTSQLLFAGMRLAGQQMEMKMGLGLTQLVDPHDGGQTSLMSAILDLLASLVFLAVNGHQLLIRALVSSYQLFPLPLAATTATVSLMEVLFVMIEAVGGIFSIALRVSAPVVVGLLLADVVLGVTSRMVPQLNLFAVILPVQFAFGLLLLFLAVPFLVWFCADQLSTIGVQLSMWFAPRP